jgi:hypothetical protein
MRGLLRSDRKTPAPGYTAFMRAAPLLLLSLAVSAVSAQPAPPSPGPAVGATAPDFRAPDQTGKQWALADLMGPKGLMLVFFRSADW